MKHYFILYEIYQAQLPGKQFLHCSTRAIIWVSVTPLRKYLQQPPEKTQTVSPDPKSVQMEATVLIIYATYDKKPYSNYLYILGKIFSLSFFVLQFGNYIHFPLWIYAN